MIAWKVFAAAAAIASVSASKVVLSNTALPLDTQGNMLLTGELTMMNVSNTWYVYMNNWGGCSGVDCCPSGDGCASCCFNPPSPTYPDPCVYTNNHSVVVYSTTDFQTWTFGGEALPLANRKVGIEFRPQVVYSSVLDMFVMWYEDRWSGQGGYAVATSKTPTGPFTTLYDTVRMYGKGRVGDYDVFVDDDGTCYHVRTGITIEKLVPNCTMPSGQTYELPNGGVEGPSMFKRDGIYYILVGLGCCACRGGSNVVVYTSSTGPMGPYSLAGDVGSNSTAGHVFDKHSPYNYVTRAQGSKVVRVPAADGSIQYLWVGNQWVSAEQPGAPRNHDLLYWTLLQFNQTGFIQQIVRQDSVTLSLP